MKHHPSKYVMSQNSDEYSFFNSNISLVILEKLGNSCVQESCGVAYRQLQLIFRHLIVHVYAVAYKYTGTCFSIQNPCLSVYI